MTTPTGDTCWTLVRRAASGDRAARERFSAIYLGTIRAFLQQRWRDRWMADHLDDAAQEVFVECLKPGGVLDAADQGAGDFRGLLYAVTRNVARRHEERALARLDLQPEESAWIERVASDDPGQETQFDRGWARSLVQKARDLHVERADDDDARRRIELLRRRFQGDEAIRDIARAWGVPAQDVHNAYRKARKEFFACLREIVACHAGAEIDLDTECRRLLGLLG